MTKVNGIGVRYVKLDGWNHVKLPIRASEVGFNDDDNEDSVEYVLFIKSFHCVCES